MRNLAALAAATLLAASGRAQTPADTSIYVGWRVYETHCASCHGVGAAGTSFAPELAPRIARMDFRRFRAALEDGYPGVDSLPAWGRNPDVARYYAELWDYLSARAEDAVPAGPLRPAQ